MLDMPWQLGLMFLFLTTGSVIKCIRRQFYCLYFAAEHFYIFVD